MREVILIMRLARINDLDQIMSIIEQTKAIMQAENNDQWDNDYPNEQIFRQDIAEGNLYVAEFGNEVGGFICLNDAEEAAYRGLAWSNDTRSLVVHRMAIRPDLRQQGLAGKLLDFAEQIARGRQLSYLRADTYAINEKMQGLFKKKGFRFVGVLISQDGELVFGKEGSFYAYEKEVEAF